MSSKKTTKPQWADPNYNALEEPTNESFSLLMADDDMEYIGDVCVDSGQIELGDVGKVYVRAATACGDGRFPVYKGKKYLVIPIDWLDHMRWSEQLQKWCVENPDEA